MYKISLQMALSHRVRTPTEAFFHWNLELLGLVKLLGQMNYGAFGVFSAKLSALILVQWVPCPCFPLLNHYFYKKLSLYIHLTNTYLGLGFEVGLQKIRNLAFLSEWKGSLFWMSFLSFSESAQFGKRSQNSNYCLSSDNLNNNLYVISKNETTNSPIHQLRI